jgi:hypothetical protein
LHFDFHFHSAIYLASFKLIVVVVVIIIDLSSNKGKRGGSKKGKKRERQAKGGKGIARWEQRTPAKARKKCKDSSPGHHPPRLRTVGSLPHHSDPNPGSLIAAPITAPQPPPDEPQPPPSPPPHSPPFPPTSPSPPYPQPET